MAVVDAADRAALRAAEDLLGGHLSAEIGHLAEEVRMALALVEVGLDFSDQDIEIAPPQEIADRLSRPPAAPWPTWAAGPGAWRPAAAGCAWSWPAGPTPASRASSTACLRPTVADRLARGRDDPR